MSDRAPRVDVGVVTWNSASLTSQALKQLLETDQGAELRLLVWDNASEDGTAEAVSALSPDAVVVRSSQNIGFARAVNQLLARSDAPWFFALNSDAWPEPGALGRLVETAESHPRAAVVVPKLLRPDGTLEHSTHPFPSMDLAIIDALGGRRLLSRRWAEARCLEGAWAHDRRRAVDWAVGAALLMRRSAVDEIGALDERFFLYLEDLEWCFRARAAGWEVWFEPSAVVRHVRNVSGALRFGEKRAALEDANLRLFLAGTMGPRRAAWYHALETVAVTRQYAWARLVGDRDSQAYWRLMMRTSLGLVPPPVLFDPEAPVGSDQEPSPAGEAGAGNPVVAVVVPTHNRGARLPRLVTALEKQTLPSPSFEVVIVDDCSTDRTSDTLAELGTSTSLRLRTLRTPERSGSAAARNLGWRAVAAPVIAFTDDDCVPDPYWLEAGLAAMDGRARVVVGRTAPPSDQLELASRPFARVMEVNDARLFESCNVFYRRRDLRAVDGFDERFRRPSGEDTHLGLRVAELGVSPVFSAEAVVFHDVRPGSASATLKEALRWSDLPLVVKGRAYARASLHVPQRVFWKASHPPAILAAAGILLATRWRPGLALAAPWLAYRLWRDPVCARWPQRLSTLPAALAVDLTEVAVMARGSVRHRTLVL